MAKNITLNYKSLCYNIASHSSGEIRFSFTNNSLDCSVCLLVRQQTNESDMMSKRDRARRRSDVCVRMCVQTTQGPMT